MDALFDGAIRQIKDTTNLALRNETEVVVNRETIQTNSTEIICLKTSLELQEDKLERLEGLIKHQEANLGFQK